MQVPVGRDLELIAVWTDPSFDPGQRAVCYVRVLEIPTRRWTAYEARRFGIQMDTKVLMIGVAADVDGPEGSFHNLASKSAT